MKRSKFLKMTAGAVVVLGAGGFMLSDKTNFTRKDLKTAKAENSFLNQEERNILYLASLAPSGHNTQPWFIKHIEPFHWIICNDNNRWLPAVDSTQRETILSIGAFAQTMEYAAANAGYDCIFTTLASTNQEEDVLDVKLVKTASIISFDINKIRKRRTVRSNYLSDALKLEDQNALFDQDKEFFKFIPVGSKEYEFLNEQTIEANKIQSYRDDAEQELSEWIRFSSSSAEKNMDGLTTASMEIGGLSGFVVRNFYDKTSVMKNSFRDKNIESVIKQVSQSAGWLLIASKDNSVTALLDAGRSMQRLFLKVRDRGVALHPMTQILEEEPTRQSLNQSLGINDNIQFILRLGYLKTYPDPVSLRRPVDWFVRPLE